MRVKSNLEINNKIYNPRQNEDIRNVSASRCYIDVMRNLNHSMKNNHMIKSYLHLMFCDMFIDMR